MYRVWYQSLVISLDNQMHPSKKSLFIIDQRQLTLSEECDVIVGDQRQDVAESSQLLGLRSSKICAARGSTLR